MHTVLLASDFRHMLSGVLNKCLLQVDVIISEWMG